MSTRKIVGRNAWRPKRTYSALVQWSWMQDKKWTCNFTSWF